MAENQSQDQERTEQPTAKKLRDSRKKGQVARSRELTMTIVMVVAALVFVSSGGWIMTSMQRLLRSGLTIDTARIHDPNGMVNGLVEGIQAGIFLLLPLLLILPIAALFGGAAIGGFSFSFQAMQPKLSKLSPAAGFKRMFGLHGLMELVKAVAKAGVVSLCGIAVLYTLGPQILSLGQASFETALAQAGKMAGTTLLVCSASLGVIALVDVPYQLFSHNKRLRMTRKEVQDEMKETDGRPEVKSRIRQLQQELANRRMLKAVPQADVVVTNPSHYAVALKYEAGNMHAPIVVAKGVDHMAAQIRTIATANAVPLFEAPMLARSLYATSEVDQEIDARLYRAVAQLLTYIYQLRRAESNEDTWPDRPSIILEDELTSPEHINNGH